MAPLVSIIIPVYNGSNYLKDAIDSALAQTYKHIEVIVVNDGSNDNGATEKIAKSYGSKIRYFKKKNGGVATALNLGIKKMKGEYLSWLSHDDMYYPFKISKQMSLLSSMEQRQVALYSDYALLQDGAILPVRMHHEMLTRKKKYALLRGAINGITVLLPKSIIDEVGVFNKRLRCTQDYDYWSRVQKKYDFIHMPEVLSVTRVHPEQGSFISPHVVTEGNSLWIKMIKELSVETKIGYEHTLYGFYFEMIKFLETTPYVEAINYCAKQLSKLEPQYAIDKIDHKVTVVMPFFNRVKATIRALNSVKMQTYDNVEVLLVNDASTDDISEVVKYVADNDFVRLVSLPNNRGPAKARNVGIEKATGEYIAFLDSDDEFLHNKIEHQLLQMLKHNPDCSYTSYVRRWGDEDHIISSDISGVVVPRIIAGCPIATPTVMVSRRLMLDNNIRFDESMEIGEDTCFWLEIAKHHEIYLVDKPLTVVNVSKESSAYNDSKLLLGFKNIISYLTSSEYYVKFSSEIALLCKDFYEINKRFLEDERCALKIKGYCLEAGIRQKIIAALKRSAPCRVVRKFRKDGAPGVLRALNKRILHGRFSAMGGSKNPKRR